jgi:lysozyme family protein
MASFDVAYNWMMDNEDRGRKYATVPDTGGMAISGINSAAYPAQFSAINAQPQSTRGMYVENFYLTEFWNQWYAQLVSDEVAKRVFDAAVNMGPGTACKLLQIAVRTTAHPIATDGEWGPDTVAAANDSNSESLVAVFQKTRLAHYQSIVASNPSDEKYLGTEEQPGPWWTRSMK